MFKLLLLFILSHFLADFILQKNSVIQLKKISLHKGLTIHIFIHFIVMSIAGTVFHVTVGSATGQQFYTTFIAISIITIIHYLIDWVKETILKKHTGVVIHSSLFLLDQILHIASIIIVLNFLGLTSYSSIEIFKGVLTFLFDGVEADNYSKFLFISIMFILVTTGAGYLIGILLRDLAPSSTLSKDKYSISDEKTEIKTKFNENGEEIKEVTRFQTEQFYRDSSKNIGRYIGMIERVLIVIFIVQGIPHGLTFLIAVKSLTRFKQFENKEFAEYYLIGSLLSALIAVMFGYLVLRIL